MIRLILLSLLVLTAPLHAINVLILGSSEGFDKRETPEGHDTHLDLAKLAPALERVLNRGKSPNNGAKVVFQDTFAKTSTPVALGSAGNEIPTEFLCHSLAQYYFWPEGREARLANLSNQGDTQWDYIFIAGDPYLISQMPGIYAEGVHLVTGKIKEGNAKVVLITPWHSNPAINKNISEVVQRVGQGLMLPVAPAGDVWTKSGDKLQEGDAEYLTAASIFSAVSNGQAWSGKMAEEGLAKLSFAALKHHQANPPSSEAYADSTPYPLESLDKETIVFCHSGSSSEAGIRVALMDAMKRINVIPKPVSCNAQEDIDFNYGRANSNFEPNKRYKVDPDKFGRSYGFPMQEQSKTAEVSMLYGIDKRYFNARSYDDGTDLGIAYDMIRQGEVEKHVYAVPIRLLLAKLMDAEPSIKPLRDRWHMSRELDAATGSYMVTMLTGKNPVGDEPADKKSNEWKLWLGRKIGYETAMRMGNLR